MAFCRPRAEELRTGLSSLVSRLSRASLAIESEAREVSTESIVAVPVCGEDGRALRVRTSLMLYACN